ncbi:nicotinamidase [Noviherbaspirillum massiliense]|uniref:nicotinamidase n=1 Tax=Noviherbaspirillum massiliense TaxID=1465823 RepID=UPI000302002B|nr:nicotinamidase [Noviherbaspirillum massiliense]
MKTLEPTEKDALLTVDVQNDFVPGGKLAVPSGNEVIPFLNRYIELFSLRGLPVYATRDWHPANHCSFKPQGGIWPPHCIAGSHGAQFATGLRLPPDAIIVSKATEPDADAYSGFEQTGLASQLRARGVERLYIGGLATDYCVLNTVIDAMKEGFEVVLLLDAIAAVNLCAGDGEAAIEEMIQQGAQPARLAELESASRLAARPPLSGRRANGSSRRAAAR